MRLDLALIALEPGLSRRKAREAIEKGQVSVDGRTVLEAGADVPKGARIAWDRNRRALPRARLSLPLLYRDDALLIVDKPAGLLSVPSAPGRADEDTVLRRVQDYVRRLRPKHPYAGVVHRLDRDTSGSLAFALVEPARAALRALFREHRVERRYSTLVAGAPPADEGQVDLPIRDAYVAGQRGVARGDQPSRPALTRWRVVERLHGATLLDVELHTGRQHQIRVHLAAIGLPVLGDTVYGKAPAPRSVHRQMLHAGLLAFAHPLSAEPVRVSSPLPDDFQRVLRDLRRR